MDRLYKPKRIKQEPLISICWVLCIGAFVGGIWVLTGFIPGGLDLLQPGPTSAVYQTAASSAGLILLAMGAFASGTMMAYGIKKNRKWLERGLYLNLILRTYTFLVGLLIYGLGNAWITPLMLIIITLIVYLAVKVKR